MADNKVPIGQQRAESMRPPHEPTYPVSVGPRTLRKSRRWYEQQLRAGLRIADLNIEHCLVRLQEKGGTLRWQPISPTLMRHLLQHIHQRGGTTRTDRVFRYRNGRAMGRRRYDTLHQRLRTHLPWAATLQITAHWFRHTTLTFVEREFGIAVARAYAGHTAPGSGSGSGSTLTYVKAGLPEVVEALVAITGEPHPLSGVDQQPPIAPSGITTGITKI
ncbi:hypothetical protein [Nocardia sp. bgisy118]|uniref:hypothetical protein n=1 Tax=Nocardia sp. bgisy118 TaxID=3413786 RepID=UPI003F4A0A9B